MSPDTLIESDNICKECCAMLDSFKKYSHKIKKIQESFKSLIRCRDEIQKMAQQIDIKTETPEYEESIKFTEIEATELPKIEQPPPDELDFECTECNKHFNDKIIFNVHLRYVHNQLPKEPPAVCEVCGQQFETQALRRNHKLYCGDKKKFNCRCEECGIDFANIWKLKRHFTATRIHNNEHMLKTGKYKQVTCDICGKTIFKCNLKNHMIIHENKKLFKCRCCFKRFNQRANLIIHMKASHATVMMGVHNIACGQCGAPFDKLEKYEEHMDSMHLNGMN